MPGLTLDHLEKRYDDHVAVVDVSLSIADGEFVSLLGPSGCGKTTILRMIAGLIDPSGGNIRIGERDITRVPTNQRRIGLVFQSYALFPHMSVFENIAFGLRRQGVRGKALRMRVEQVLQSVRLDGYAQRLPRQLSGGQQQRVAIARSIAPQPGILLFDEPLSNLDAALRDDMQIELKRLQREVGITTLFVTHDQTEAMSMSDRVCVLAHGVVQQFARPEDIYHRPATGFVAGFIGRPNRLKGVLQTACSGSGNAVVVLAPGVEVPVARPAGVSAGDMLDVVLRQEGIRLHAINPTPASESTDRISYVGRIALRSFIGARVQYVVELAPGLEIIADMPSNDAQARLEQGVDVRVSVAAEHVYVSKVTEAV